MTTHHLLPNLQPYTILLASQSPRRQQLLSEMGITFTAKIKEAARYLDIRVVDHLIVSEQGYYSFADEGVL